MVHLTPDAQALTVAVGLAAQLTATDAPPEAWDSLTAALLAEHTPEQLAGMVTEAAALIVRTARG